MSMQQISLVYGIVESPPAALAREAARPARAGGIGPMAATIVESTPAFRLNSPGWANAGPDVMQTVAGTTALIEYCRARLINRVSVFSLALRSFLSAYVDLALAQVESRRDELEARLRAAGLPVDEGFPGYRDWVFSALLPVPQAHVALPGEAGPAAVDVLFWTGRSALALTLEGRSMPTRSRRLAREALLAAHPTVQAGTLPVPCDGRSWEMDGLLERLGGDLLPDGGLPFGPYRILPDAS